MVFDLCFTQNENKSLQAGKVHSDPFRPVWWLACWSPSLYRMGPPGNILRFWVPTLKGWPHCADFVRFIPYLASYAMQSKPDEACLSYLMQFQKHCPVPFFSAIGRSVWFVWFRATQGTLALSFLLSSAVIAMSSSLSLTHYPKVTSTPWALNSPSLRLASFSPLTQKACATWPLLIVPATLCLAVKRKDFHIKAGNPALSFICPSVLFHCVCLIGLLA